MAAFVALASAGLFFLVGLMTGVWKYRQMMQSPDGRASKYVNIAHSASLFYAFACLLLERFCTPNALPGWAVLGSVAVLVFFFAAAVISYIVFAFAKRETTQFADRTFHTTWGMWLLIVGEVGGFLALFGGWVLAR